MTDDASDASNQCATLFVHEWALAISGSVAVLIGMETGSLWMDLYVMPRKTWSAYPTRLSDWNRTSPVPETVVRSAILAVLTLRQRMRAPFPFRATGNAPTLAAMPVHCHG